MRNQPLRGLLCAALAAVGASCLYIPPFTKLERTAARQIARVVPGVTTRGEVLEAFGDPNVASCDAVDIYAWEYNQGRFVLLVGPMGGDVSAEQLAMAVEYDGDKVLRVSSWSDRRGIEVVDVRGQAPAGRLRSVPDEQIIVSTPTKSNSIAVSAFESASGGELVAVDLTGAVVRSTGGTTPAQPILPTRSARLGAFFPPKLAIGGHGRDVFVLQQDGTVERLELNALQPSPAKVAEVHRATSRFDEEAAAEPEGARLAVRGGDGVIFVLDRDGHELRRIATPKKSKEPLGWAGPARVKVGRLIWDLDSGAQVDAGENGVLPKGDLQFTSDGRWIAVLHRGAVTIWDAAIVTAPRGARGRPFYRGAYLGARPGRKPAIAFSPDDRWMAIRESDTRVWLWSLDSGAAPDRIECTTCVNYGPFDPPPRFSLDARWIYRWTNDGIAGFRLEPPQ
jgi:hypothetical protein